MQESSRILTLHKQDITEEIKSSNPIHSLLFGGRGDEVKINIAYTNVRDMMSHN